MIETLGTILGWTIVAALVGMALVPVLYLLAAIAISIVSLGNMRDSDDMRESDDPTNLNVFWRRGVRLLNQKIILNIGAGNLWPDTIKEWISWAGADRAAVEFFKQRKKKARLVREIQKYSETKLDDVEIFEELVRVKNQGELVQYASERLRGNRELMLIAVENPNLKFTSYGNNRVIGETGSPLEYASNELKNDREVVLNAIYHSVDAFKLSSPELRGDPQVIWAAANQFQPDGEISLRDVLGNIPEVFFSNHSAFYQFLIDLFDGSQWEEGREQGFEPSDVEDYISYSDLPARITELFHNRELFLRALDETEWASRYAPQKFTPEELLQLQEEEAERKRQERQRTEKIDDLRGLLKIIEAKKSGSS